MYTDGGSSSVNTDSTQATQMRKDASCKTVWTRDLHGCVSLDRARTTGGL